LKKGVAPRIVEPPSGWERDGERDFFGNWKIVIAEDCYAQNPKCEGRRSWRYYSIGRVFQYWSAIKEAARTSTFEDILSQWTGRIKLSVRWKNKTSLLFWHPNLRTHVGRGKQGGRVFFEDGTPNLLCNSRTSSIFHSLIDTVSQDGEEIAMAAAPAYSNLRPCGQPCITGGAMGLGDLEYIL
jgi:hypothetical protein